MLQKPKVKLISMVNGYAIHFQNWSGHKFDHTENHIQLEVHEWYWSFRCKQQNQVWLFFAFHLWNFLHTERKQNQYRYLLFKSDLAWKMDCIAIIIKISFTFAFSAWTKPEISLSESAVTWFGSVIISCRWSIYSTFKTHNFTLLVRC